MAMRIETEETPLQVKLNILTEKIAKMGLSIALMLEYININN